MATVAQIQTAINTWVSNRIATIRTRQETYAANHGGRYWQARWTHSTEPVDGAATAPDTASQTPHDQPGGWAIVNYSLPATLPLRARFDVWKSPQGWGWTLIARFKALNGDIYERRWHGAGPGDTSAAWAKVNPVVNPQ